MGERTTKDLLIPESSTVITPSAHRIRSLSRRSLLLGILLCGLVGSLRTLAGAPAASQSPGLHRLRIRKVLPQLMDLEGRHTLSPSLLERDAYQAVLRKEKEKRGGLKFQILLGAMAANTAKECSIRIEMRGNKDQKPTEAKVEVPVAIHGMFQRWQAVEFRGAEYLALGELVAWRATLWRSGTLVSEQKSFLW